MNDLQYFLFLLAVYSGNIAGFLISFMAKEELSSGRKYLIILRGIVIGCIVFFFLYSFSIHIMLSGILSIISALILFKTRINDLFYYSMLSAIVFFAKDYNAIIGSLVFFSFIIIISLNFEKRKVKALIPSFAFLFLGIILRIIFRAS